MPVSCETKLAFEHLVAFTTGNGVENQVYCLNGLYDPTLGGASGASLVQPRGFDQLAKFYRRYVVKASKVTMRVHNGSAYAIRANMIFSAGTSPIVSDIHKDAEQPFSRTLMLASTDSGPTAKTMTKYMAHRKLYGDPSADAEDYGALVTANPSKQLFVTGEVGAVNVGNGIDKIVQVVTRIVFYCMFYDLRPLAASTGADEPT